MKACPFCAAPNNTVRVDGEIYLPEASADTQVGDFYTQEGK